MQILQRFRRNRISVMGQAAYIAGTMLQAGSDTTSNTLYASDQAMVVFSEAQKKSQRKRLIAYAASRLPAVGRAKSPMHTSCIKRRFHGMPTTPTGGEPHTVTQDGKYMDDAISRAAGGNDPHMDPNRYPEPRHFNPRSFRGRHAKLRRSS